MLSPGAQSGSPIAGAALHTTRAQSELEPAQDLSADGRESSRRRAPLMLVFTTRSCPYCARAKREYLVPMNRDPAYRDKVMLREIDARAALPLRDFAGVSTTHAQFARSYKVRIVPTLIVVDAGGSALAEPIVGLLGPDFYGAYLDHAIDEGLAALRARAGSPAPER